MRKGDHWLADRVYSGVPAGDFGLQQVIRVGHMSGRSNILWWLEQNGVEATDELVAHLLEVAKSQPRNMENFEIEQVITAFNESA
jgi:2-isopropylmalate synthase